MQKELLAGLAIAVVIFGMAGGAIATPVNVAPLGTATQSSTYPMVGYDRSAKVAIDGNTDGNIWSGSVSHTFNDPQAWWQVDLGTIYDIDSIVLWNRTDSNGERLNNFNVSVLDGEGKLIWIASNLSTFPSSLTLTLPDNILGEIVKVQLIGWDYLQLAEVQVFGSNPVPEPSTMLLLGTGIAGLLGPRIRRNK